MERPYLGQQSRTVAWDAMRIVWMDTDEGLLLDWIVGECAESNYLLVHRIVRRGSGQHSIGKTEESSARVQPQDARGKLR